MGFISVIILIICFLLALVVLAQNPKGGGLAAGFTGAQQIGGVQKTADFLEKGTWTLSGALMVLCLVSAGIQGTVGGSELDDLDGPVEQQYMPPEEFNQEELNEPPEETPLADPDGQNQ